MVFLIFSSPTPGCQLFKYFRKISDVKISTPTLCGLLFEKAFLNLCRNSVLGKLKDRCIGTFLKVSAFDAVKHYTLSENIALTSS